MRSNLQNYIYSYIIHKPYIYTYIDVSLNCIIYRSTQTLYQSYCTFKTNNKSQTNQIVFAFGNVIEYIVFYIVGWHSC